MPIDCETINNSEQSEVNMRGRARRACVDIYLSFEASEVDSMASQIREAWITGKAIYYKNYPVANIKKSIDRENNLVESRINNFEE